MAARFHLKDKSVHKFMFPISKWKFKLIRDMFHISLCNLCTKSCWGIDESLVVVTTGTPQLNLYHKDIIQRQWRKISERGGGRKHRIDSVTPALALLSSSSPHHFFGYIQPNPPLLTITPDSIKVFRKLFTTALFLFLKLSSFRSLLLWSKVWVLSLFSCSRVSS